MKKKIKLLKLYLAALVVVGLGAGLFFAQSSGDLVGNYKSKRIAKKCEMLKKEDPNAWKQYCASLEISEKKDRDKQSQQTKSEARDTMEEATSTTGTPSFAQHTSSTAPCPSTTLVPSASSEIYCFSVTASNGDVTINDFTFQSTPVDLDNSILSTPNGFKLYGYDGSTAVISSSVLGEGTWSSNFVDVSLSAPEVIVSGSTHYYLLRAPISLVNGFNNSGLATRLEHTDSFQINYNGLPTGFLLLSESIPPPPGNAQFEKHTSSTAPCPSTTLVASSSAEIYCFSVAASNGDVTINDLTFESVPTALDQNALATGSPWKLHQYNSLTGAIDSTVLAQGSWDSNTFNVSMSLFTEEIVADGTTSYFLLRAPINFVPDVVSSTLATRLEVAETEAPSTMGSNGLPTPYLLLAES